MCTFPQKIYIEKADMLLACDKWRAGATTHFICPIYITPFLSNNCQNSTKSFNKVIALILYFSVF